MDDADVVTGLERTQGIWSHPPHGEPLVLWCTVAWVYPWWTILRPWTLRHPVLHTLRSSTIRVTRATLSGRALRHPHHGHAARPDASSRDKMEERGNHASSLVHPAPWRARPSPSSVCRTLLCMVGRNWVPSDAVSHLHRVCQAGRWIDLPRVPPRLLHPCDIPCSGLVHPHGTSPTSSRSRAAGHPYCRRPSSGPP
jgi:hypothetical protein